MRYSLLAAALGVALGTTSFTAAADSRDQQIAELREQMAAMQAKLLELEERSDAQSGVNIDTAGALDKLANNSTKVETKGGLKVTSADKKFEASLGGRIHFDAYAFDRDIADTTGTWSITMTLPDGTMCLMASGSTYEAVTEDLPARGNPA